MRGAVAKRIRREHQDAGMPSKAHQYFKGDNGVILADRPRRIYQMRKDKHHES